MAFGPTKSIKPCCATCDCHRGVATLRLGSRAS
jgi:hypothetical protein